MPSFSIIRDLVVDMTNCLKQYHSISPYLIDPEPPPEKKRLQSPAQRDELNGAYECIMRGCCSSQCPSFWWNPDKFVGPAGLIKAYRFIVDSRDHATHQRLDNLNDAYRLFRGHTIMNCSEVRPKAPCNLCCWTYQKSAGRPFSPPPGCYRRSLSRQLRDAYSPAIATSLVPI